jgi:uncharacterized protein (TIGR02246 family)
MLSDIGIGSLFVALLLVAAPAGGAAAERAQDEIRAAFKTWTRDFNDRKSDAVCSLFSPELRYDFRGYPERGYKDICNSLKRTLTDQSKTYAYAYDIREILVEGDLAIVRLTWTLTVTLRNGQELQSIEPGLDIMRRDPDGNWKIIRYLAYSAPTSAGEN